ncbi:MAG: hypothetical protein K0R10_2733 [Alphaproteobacteria bacterium]|jgi:hypothetical protein|nr:hypothetical protein [Alphaproteobacteria bacterium]
MEKPTPRKRKAEKKKNPLMIPVIIGAAGFILFLITAPQWAVDEAGARRVLEAQGYTDIKTGGYDTFGCGFDVFATRFTARTAKGYPVKGNVCKTPYVSKSSVEIDDTPAQ